MLIVGLTGGIGSGKSTVSRMFVAHGIPVIDADVISHNLTGPGGAALDRIRAIFGDEVITDEGALNRAVVRERVFERPELRRKLEGILHPLVRREMLRKVSATKGAYCILAVPLLIESNMTDLVDRILVVDADVSARIQRIKGRSGLDETTIRRIMSAQIDDATRRARADDIIRNDDDLEQLQTEVAALHRRYLELART
ncbi:MAG: dephospho-CoA kinase [Gammaproteobacteria bacterium]|nr:dephospho-CoA kinase [Gammaproteobacteria bacterium]